jgi:hypothetical protein
LPGRANKDGSKKIGCRSRCPPTRSVSGLTVALPGEKRVGRLVGWILRQQTTVERRF